MMLNINLSQRNMMLSINVLLKDQINIVLVYILHKLIGYINREIEPNFTFNLEVQNRHLYSYSFVIKIDIPVLIFAVI
jgi:hypothetical protein